MLPAPGLGADGEEAEGLKLTLQVLTGRCESAKEEKSQGPPKPLCLHAAGSAGSLPLAGRRLGGEKARRREARAGAGGGGTGRGSCRGGQQAGEGGLKQRAANHPGGIPRLGTQERREEPLGPPSLLPRPNRPLSWHLVVGGHYQMLLFSGSHSREGRNPRQSSAGSGH